jgi:hypothetical protein
MYRAAWVLYALGCLSSGSFVIGTAVEWNRAFPQGFGRIGLLAVVVFILGLFTNVVFWAAHVAQRSPRISTSWRVLLLGSLLVDASVVFLIPEFAAVGGYWLWLLAFAIATWAFLRLPADAVPAPGPRTAPADRHPEAFISTDVPGLLWVWLGLTMFWLAVMVVNYHEFFHHPGRAAEIVVQPVALAEWRTPPQSFLI